MKKKDKDNGIALSPKHGLNPSLLQCPICHKDMGIALCGKLKGDAEAPKVMEGELCDDCKKEYIVLLEVDPSTHRLTGRHAFIKRTAVAEKFKTQDKLLMTIEDFTELANGHNNN